MNGKQAKKLKRLARTLPVVMEIVPAKLLGSVLIERGMTKTTDGKDIIATDLYDGHDTQPADHFTRLKEHYTKFGQAGVDDYEAHVKEVADNERKNTPKKQWPHQQVPAVAEEYKYPDWFNTDNVHEVGKGYVHYTEDYTGEAKDLYELAKAVNYYLGQDSNFYVTNTKLDDAVNVFLYILEPTPWMSHQDATKLQGFKDKFNREFPFTEKEAKEGRWFRDESANLDSKK